MEFLFWMCIAWVMIGQVVLIIVLDGTSTTTWGFVWRMVVCTGPLGLAVLSVCAGVDFVVQFVVRLLKGEVSQ